MGVDLITRARRYVAAMDPSVSGQGGHNAAFSAAVALVHGFALGEEDALVVLRDEFNPRCAPAWSEAELRHKVRSAAKSGSDKPRGHLAGANKSGYQEGAAVAQRKPQGPRAVAPEKKRQEFQENYRADLARDVARHLDLGDMREWLFLRSPVVPTVDPVQALACLYEAGEKVLVFNNERSQGQWGIEVVQKGKGRVWALGDRPGVKAEAVDALPSGGKCGMWFLNQPVDGKWAPNGMTNEAGDAKLSRRSTGNVTAWRYMVLESDETVAIDWLRVVACLPLPIAALYESGGRSVHALVRVNAQSLPQWNALRDRLSPFLTRVGADGAAMTAVRLTRVPNVLRYGSGMGADYVRFDKPRKQSLLWLNPFPKCVAMDTLPVVRRC